MNPNFRAFANLPKGYKLVTVDVSECFDSATTSNDVPPPVVTRTFDGELYFSFTIMCMIGGIPCYRTMINGWVTIQTRDGEKYRGVNILTRDVSTLGW
jgi:hypothetical protein